MRIKSHEKEVYNILITTNDDVELAEVINMGYNKDINQFSINIENGKSIPIKMVPPYKYVALSYFIDTIHVDYMKYYPMYE